MVEYESDEIEAAPVLVRPVLGNRKYLLIAFQCQFQGREILLDVGQQDVQLLFRGGEKYHVVGISEIVPPMIVSSRASVSLHLILRRMMVFNTSWSIDG